MKINWFKITDKEQLLREINFLILLGEKSELSKFKIYISTGDKCKDCEEYYYNCECNRCNSCKYGSCICNILDIRRYIVEFVEHNLVYHLIDKLLNKIRSTIIYEEHMLDFKNEKYIKCLEKLINYENKLV